MHRDSTLVPARVLRRTILLMAAGVAAFSLGAGPASGVAGFGDVPAGIYYSSAVQWMVDEEITTGTSASCFAPDGLVTRGQAAAFLHRMVGEPSPAAPHPFGDVVLDWQEAPVAWMFESGITTGTTSETYSPNDLVTRGEVAALVHRLAGEPDADDHPFIDVVRDWQQVPVAWMFAEGITTGTSVDTFSPDLPVTRGQYATFLYRYSAQPAVTVDPASPTCDAGAGTRQVSETDYGLFATAGEVDLHFPSDLVEFLGYHQSSHDGSRESVGVDNDVPATVMRSRGRGTPLRSAADIVVDPASEVRSPVTGTVIRSGGYQLYCEHRDEFVVIEPDDQPGWEVKVFHFQGLSVQTGDRVVGGVTVIGVNATVLPFVSQVDKFTASPSWPHVHVEVVDPSIPDRPGSSC